MCESQTSIADDKVNSDTAKNTIKDSKMENRKACLRKVSYSEIPLHTAQEGVFYEQSLYENSPLYNIGCYKFLGPNINVDTFEAVWELLTEYVEALRLSFDVTEGKPIQRIFDTGTASNVIVTLKTLEDCHLSNAPESKVLSWMQNIMNAPMRYLQGKLCEVYLLTDSQSNSALFIKCHHLMTDGYGLSTLISTFEKTYKDLDRLKNTQWLANLPSYQQAIKKNKEYTESARYERDQKYWKSVYDEYEPTKLYPYYEGKGGKHLSKPIDQNLVCDIGRLCKQGNYSILGLLISAVGYYFQSIQLDDSAVVLNTVVHGRSGKASIDTVGMHSNIIPLIIPSIGSCTFEQYFADIHTALRDSFKHSKFPSSHMSRLHSTKKGGMSDILVQYEDYSKSDSDDGFESSNLPLYSQDEKYPLQVRIQEYKERNELLLKLTYRTQFFMGDEAELLLERLMIILSEMVQSMVQSPQNEVSNIPILGLKEQQKLASYNITGKPEPLDKTLHQTFEEQVDRSPQNIAIAFQDTEINYQQLNQLVNVYSEYIRQQYRKQFSTELRAGTNIAIYLDRGIDMIIAILSILKAGGAYIPISPQAPSLRNAFMLSDCKACFVVSHGERTEEIANVTKAMKVMEACDEPAKVKVLTIDYTSLIQDTTDIQMHNPSEHSSPDAVAYTIYTSGTTGNPKGVEITHRASAARNSFMAQQGNCSNNTYLFKTNYIFDVSVSDIFCHLTSGAKIVVSEDNFDPDEIMRLIENGAIDSSHFVPSQISVLKNTADISLDLKRIYCSGEGLLRDHIENIDLTQTAVINYYGPTETGEATFHSVKSLNDENVIGRPFDGVYVYVVLKNEKLAPTGVPGELYIGGVGLAKGYLNNADLTQEKFIKNPFKSGSDTNQPETIYKTGDVVRWLPDGRLKYISRNDNQIKIRGHRIELSEVEFAINKLEGIKKALVIDIEEGTGKALCAYIVLHNGLNENALRDQLSANLPDYMIPRYFTPIDEIPLTHNGKLDRKALPEPQRNKPSAHVKPKNDFEKKLVDFWKELLKLDNVSTDEGFYNLGGDSYSIMILRSKICEFWGIKVGLDELIRGNTLSTQASIIRHRYECIDTDSNEVNLNISKTNEKVVKAHPLQQWQFEEMENCSSLRPVQVLIEPSCSYNESCFDLTIQYLTQRHAVLRSILLLKNGELYQEIRKQASPDIKIIDIEEKIGSIGYQNLVEASQRLEVIFPNKKVHELEAHPYLITVLKDSENNFKVFVSLEHSIADGYSLDILRQEFESVYQSYYEQTEPSLDELDYDYNDLSAWLSDAYLSTEMYQKDHAFWLDYASSYEPARIPFDYSVEKPFEMEEGQESVNVSAFMLGFSSLASKQLSSFAIKTGITVSNLLCASVSISLSKHLHIDNPSIGYNFSGRGLIGSEKLIGSFAVHYFLSTIAKTGVSLEEVAEQIQQDMTKISTHYNYDHFSALPIGISSGDKREIPRKTSSSVIFSYDPYYILPDEELPNIYAEKKLSFDGTWNEHQYFIWTKFFKRDGRFVLWLQYDPAYFAKNTIEKFIDTLEEVINGSLG